jgi:hypothetical protein
LILQQREEGNYESSLILVANETGCDLETGIDQFLGTKNVAHSIFIIVGIDGHHKCIRLVG